MTMDYLPLFVRLTGRDCLIIGAGPVAAGKARALIQAGARVHVRAPVISAQVSDLAATGSLRIEESTFESTKLTGAPERGWALVVAATNRGELNRQICALAQAQGVWASSVTEPADSSFIFPAIIDRSPVIAAFSTGGLSPALARHFRAKLEAALPAQLGRLAGLAGRWRARVKEKVGVSARRRAFWDQVFSGPIAELVLAGQAQRADEMLARSLDEEAESSAPMGEVYLVGAGPGDPELLTLRAMRLVQQADVVLYDRLVSAEVMALVRRDAERIYVGKRRAEHAVHQSELNQLLIDLAREGKRVLRLKGGDPFMFGRGGEEIARLAEEKIPFQVVPGITAASGCAAYAGIPLTHRDFAQSCVFVTGYHKNGHIDLDWARLAGDKQTIVVYMGLAGLEEICARLIEHGLAAETPAAIIADGTKLTQRLRVGTLATLPPHIGVAEDGAPALIIVGEVVSLHQQLAWFAPGHE